MDQGEEQLDYEDEDYGGHNPHFQTGAAISALADEEMGEDDEYDDLYHDVNVGFIAAAEQPVKQHDLGNGRGLPPRPYAAAKDDAEDRTRVDEVPAEAKSKFEGAPGAADAATKDSGVYGEEDDPHARNGGQGFARSTAGKAPADAAQRGGESTSGPASARAGTPTSAASTPNRTGPNRDSFGNDYAGRHGGGGGFAGDSGGGGGSMLFVGDLQWWTTDAELEAALSEYGKVKYMKFFEEKASGKSKGYCQVQFFDHAAARACKEGMNGRVFNGRPCVVAFANQKTVRQMGDAMANKGQNAHQQEPQPRRMMNDGGGRAGGGGSFQSGEGGRHYGARMGGSARGPHGQNRGQGGQGRGRGGMAGKNMGRGPGGSSGGGGPYGQGLLGPMGGPPGAMMHPQGMMGNQGFDPGFGAQMGRGGAGAGGAAGGAGGYGGFGPHAPPFPGMVPSFPAIGSVALPGVAPHVNPAFFGRGMAAANGMGMIPGGGGMEGHHAGMWNDSGGWGGGGGGGGGDGQNRRVGDMGYGEDAGSEYGYGEKGYDRGGGRTNVARDRERGPESDWAGHSEKRHRSEREADWERERERDRYREKERDGYRDQRERDRNWDGEGDWGKDRVLRSRSKSRTVEEDGDQWPVAKESDYGKRRR